VIDKGVPVMREGNIVRISQPDFSTSFLYVILKPNNYRENHKKNVAVGLRFDFHAKNNLFVCLWSFKLHLLLQNIWKNMLFESVY